MRYYTTLISQNKSLKNKDFLRIGRGYFSALTDNLKFLTMNTNENVLFGVFL